MPMLIGSSPGPTPVDSQSTKAIRRPSITSATRLPPGSAWARLYPRRDFLEGHVAAEVLPLHIRGARQLQGVPVHGGAGSQRRVRRLREQVAVLRPAHATAAGGRRGGDGLPVVALDPALAHQLHSARAELAGEAPVG